MADRNLNAIESDIELTRERLASTIDQLVYRTSPKTIAKREVNQVKGFFVDVNGSNPEEVASEVDRYCSWPGQACGYKVGHTEINRQRQKAQAALGSRYDLKAFNDTVVLGGNVPLDVLGKNVDEYTRTGT